MRFELLGEMGTLRAVNTYNAGVLNMFISISYYKKISSGEEASHVPDQAWRQ